MLHQEIKSKIKDAMIAKDEVLLKALRNMLSAFTNELVNKGQKPNEFLEDQDVLQVISRLAKQRKDSITQFQNGGRPDLVVEEEAELAILQKYLPEMMSKQEVEIIALVKKDELGISDVAQKGILMSGLMKDLKGKADGVLVKEVVDSLF